MFNTTSRSGLFLLVMISMATATVYGQKDADRVVRSVSNTDWHGINPSIIMERMSVSLPKPDLEASYSIDGACGETIRVVWRDRVAKNVCLECLAFEFQRDPTGSPFLDTISITTEVRDRASLLKELKRLESLLGALPEQQIGSRIRPGAELRALNESITWFPSNHEVRSTTVVVVKEGKSLILTLYHRRVST